MNCVLQDWSRFANKAMIIFHFSWIIEKFLAFIALITSGILVSTKRTFTFDESISQEQVAFFTIALSHFLLLDFVLFFEIQKDILTNLSVPFSWSSTKMIKGNIEPFVHFRMNFMIKITNFTWSFLFFQCLYFCGCTIFVCAAYV